MHKFYQLAEFKVLYPEYRLANYDGVLNGIGKDILLRVLTFLIGKDLYSGDDIDNAEVLGGWFSENNQVFADEAMRRIDDYEQQHGRKLTLVSVISCLQLLQRSLELEEEGALNTKSKERSEIDLFFAMLLANQQEDESQTRHAGTIKKHFPDHEPAAVIFHLGFATGDIINFNYADYSYCQIIKALLLFQFMEKDPDTSELMKRFNQYYNIANWREYIEFVLPMATAWSKGKEKSSVDIELKNDEHYPGNYGFLRRMALDNYVRLDDMDYLKLREKPLLELDPHNFRIIHPLFIADKIFKGLYFLFNQLNSEVPKLIKEFRTWYTTHFSEEISFRRVLEYIYSTPEVLFFDPDIVSKQATVVGPPDGYLRNANNVFLLESKDILINAKVKASYDFENVLADIQKKLYEKDGKPIGLGQLVTNIRKLLDGTNTYDAGFLKDQAAIYPILITHDRMFDASGLNRLLGVYFYAELQKLSAAGLDVSLVRPLIVMNIDSLILFADILRDGRVTMEELCEAYYTNFTIPPPTSFSSMEEYEQAYRETLVSFYDFSVNYINRKLGQAWRSWNLLNHLFQH